MRREIEDLIARLNEPKYFAPDEALPHKTYLSSVHQDDMQEAATALRKLMDEREAWKSAAKGAGVCMTCALGLMEPCTDCLGTGFESGMPARDIELAKENDMLRAVAANGGGPCVYCSLDRKDWPKCNSGFPGCSRTDDTMLCPHVGRELHKTGLLVIAGAALLPLVKIWDAYEANNLDDEARRFWGKYNENENRRPPEKIELYSGRGGNQLLTLKHVLDAATFVKHLHEEGVLEQGEAVLDAAEYRCSKCGAQADERFDCCEIFDLTKSGDPV